MRGGRALRKTTLYWGTSIAQTEGNFNPERDDSWFNDTHCKHWNPLSFKARQILIQLKKPRNTSFLLFLKTRSKRKVWPFCTFLGLKGTKKTKLLFGVKVMILEDIFRSCNWKNIYLTSRKGSPIFFVTANDQLLSFRITNDCKNQLGLLVRGFPTTFGTGKVDVSFFDPAIFHNDASQSSHWLRRLIKGS